MNPFKVDLLNDWHPKKEERLHIVMLYEDLAMGRQAKQLFDKVEAEFDEAMGFDYGLWRVDALRTADCFMNAASEAVGAEMVVLAVHDPALSEQMWSWLETWVAEAHADTALVVLFDRSYGAEQAVTIKRRLVELIGYRQITIFAESVAVEELSRPVSDAKEGETFEGLLPMSPRHVGCMDDPVRALEAASWHRWGIND